MRGPDPLAAITAACPKTCGQCGDETGDDKPEECVNSDSATLMAALGTSNCCMAKMRGHSCSSDLMKQHCARACRHCTPSTASYSHSPGKSKSGYRTEYTFTYQSSSSSSSSAWCIFLIVGVVLLCLVCCAMYMLCLRAPAQAESANVAGVVQPTTGTPISGTEFSLNEAGEKVMKEGEKVMKEFGGRECVSAPNARSCGVFVAAQPSTTTTTTSTTSSTGTEKPVYHN